jgi:Fe-S-cluster containining protein
MHFVSQPWYFAGLPFECTQCGDCCTGAPGYVWVDNAEIGAIAEHLGKSVGEIRLLHTRPARGAVSLTEHLNGDCTFLDPQTRRCRVYPARPVQCRTWPFWSGNLATPEHWERTCQVCPGAGRGELVPLETIQERVAQTPL